MDDLASNNEEEDKEEESYSGSESNQSGSYSGNDEEGERSLSQHSDGSASHADDRSSGSEGSVRRDERRRRRRRPQSAAAVDDDDSYSGSQQTDNSGPSRRGGSQSGQSEGDGSRSYNSQDDDDDDDGSRSYYSDERSRGSHSSRSASERSRQQQDEDFSRGSHSQGSRSYNSGDDDDNDDRSYRSGSYQGSRSYYSGDDDDDQSRSRSYYSDEERSRSYYSGSERSQSPDSRQSQSSYDQSHDMLSLIQEEDSKAEQSIRSGRTPSVIAEEWEREQDQSPAPGEDASYASRGEESSGSSQQQDQSNDSQSSQPVEDDDQSHTSRRQDDVDDGNEADDQSRGLQPEDNSSNGVDSQQSPSCHSSQRLEDEDDDASETGDDQSEASPSEPQHVDGLSSDNAKSKVEPANDAFDFGELGFGDDAFASGNENFPETFESNDAGFDAMAASEPTFNKPISALASHEPAFGADFDFSDGFATSFESELKNEGSLIDDRLTEATFEPANNWSENNVPSKNHQPIPDGSAVDKKTAEENSGQAVRQLSIGSGVEGFGQGEHESKTDDIQTNTAAATTAPSRVQALAKAFDESDPRQKAAMLLARAGISADASDETDNGSLTGHSHSGSDSWLRSGSSNGPEIVNDSASQEGEVVSNHSGFVNIQDDHTAASHESYNHDKANNVADSEELEDSLSISNLENSDAYLSEPNAQPAAGDSDRDNFDSKENSRSQGYEVAQDRNLASSETSYKSSSRNYSERSGNRSAHGPDHSYSERSSDRSHGSASYSRSGGSQSPSSASKGSHSQESARSRDFGSSPRSDRSHTLSPHESEHSYSQRSGDGSLSSGAHAQSEGSCFDRPEGYNTLLKSGQSRCSGSSSRDERDRPPSLNESDHSQGTVEESHGSGSYSQSERSHSISPGVSEGTYSQRSGSRSRGSNSLSNSERSRSPMGHADASRNDDYSSTDHSNTVSRTDEDDYHSDSSSMEEYPPSGPSTAYAMNGFGAQNSGGASGSTMNDSTPSFANESAAELESSFRDTSTTERSQAQPDKVHLGPKGMNDSSAGSSAAESFAAESFANESVTENDGFDVSPTRSPSASPQSSVRHGLANADAIALPTESVDGHVGVEQQEDSFSADTENSYESDGEEDSFFERTLIAQEPDMLPKITEHSVAEKSDYDESERYDSTHASVEDEKSFESQRSSDDEVDDDDHTEEGTIKSLKSMFSSASRRSQQGPKSAAGSVVSGASGLRSVDTVDISIVSEKSDVPGEKGRLIAQRKGYTREQMTKLRHERRPGENGMLDDGLRSVGGDDVSRGDKADKSFSGLKRKRRRAKVQVKSDALLELVANVSEAMDEIAQDNGDEEKKDEDESAAKQLLLGFEALVGIILQFSDELELMSTFARKKDAASIDALQSLINFAPVIDDVFVELKPILQQCLVDDVDEEMNDLLYGMNLTVDLLCEMTHLVGERQEWNIRANTSYVTLLELLSRDALEVACIFDDIDTPEYELTEQIEDAWANTGHEEEFKTLQVTTDLTVFRQICYDVMLSMDNWCPDINTLMDICGIDDLMLETETVEDHPDDRMFETPETALQVLEKINGDVLARTLTMSRVMRRIMPTDFITDQMLRGHIRTLRGTIRDQLGLPVSNLIAISSVPEVLNEPESPGIAGVGKTTMAAMVANHPDTRKFFNDGIAWIHIGQKEVTYTRYIQCLRELMAQIDIGDDEEPLFPELLHVPSESQAKRRRREEGFMMYAREIMVDFLQFRNVLIILDDVCFEPDLDWFDFDPAALQAEENDDEFSCVILVTTRCRNLLPAADTVEVDMLAERESIELLIQESGELASSLGASTQTNSVVKECAYHPLAVKSVGRWLNLKHATAGATSSPEEMHQDVITSMEMILKSANQEDADMMYEVLNMSLSPAINGQPTNIIKFCFAAFVLVFCDKNQVSDFALADATPIVPLTIAETLFEALLESEEQTLLQEGSLFYAQKKEAAVLIPEALSALGVLKVIITFTAAETTDDDSQPEEIEEKYLQVMHAVQEEYGEYLHQEETTLADLTKDAQERWNRAFGLAYLANAPDWTMETPDAGVDYAFEMLPAHLILGGLYIEAGEMLTNAAYVKGRLFALGRENGTRRHIKDCEGLFDRMMEKRLAGRKKLDPKATMKKAYEVLGSLINMDEDEYIAQEGSTEALEVARAHSEIAFSLAEKRCWDAAITYWETSQELLVQSLGMVELVAGIQLNIGVLYGEMNEFERALNAMKQCLKIRGAIHGEEHILYAQTIQKIGDIFLKMSDYHEAMESYNWALDTLHVEPSHHRIDIGDILENMGSIYYSKGEIDEALQCYQDALRSKEVDLGEDHPELATTFQFIGNCLSDQGKTEEAIAHYEEAIRLKLMDAEKGGEREADILTMQGVLHNLNGRQQEGLECYEKALQVLVTKVPHKKEKVASLLHLIGCVYLMSGAQKKAMKLFEESLQARRKVLGFVHLDVASTLFNMAFLFQSRNRLDKALKCLEEALKIRQLRLPDSEKVAITHEKIGTLARSIGKTKKAEIAFNEALRIRKLIHGSDHEAVAAVLQELGDLMDDLGEYDEAMKHYVEALDIRQTQLGPDDLAVAETLYSMGFSLQNNGATGRALQCFEESLSIRKFQLGDDAKEVGDTLNMMGFLHAQRGELDDALALLWDALRVRKLQEDHLKVSETLKNIGNVHREKQEYELAIECYEECLRIRRAAVGDNHEKVADAFIAIGNVQSDLDIVDDAMRSYEEALRIRTMIHGEQDESVAAVLQYMGTLEFRAEQLDRALQLLNEFIRIREEIGTANDGDHVNVLFMIGNIHKLKGDDFEAQRCWTEAYKVFKELGLADPEVAAVMEQLVGGSDSHREPTADAFRNKESNDAGLFGKLSQKVKSTQRAKKGKGQQL